MSVIFCILTKLIVCVDNKFDTFFFNSIRQIFLITFFTIHCYLE